MNKEQLIALQVKHGLPATLNVYDALLAAFDAGVKSAEEAKGLSPHDAAQLTALGINPTKSFRIRNSTFTITAFNPSRWKYPVSAKNQNGRGFKFTISQVVEYQK